MAVARLISALGLGLMLLALAACSSDPPAQEVGETTVSPQGKEQMEKSGGKMPARQATSPDF